jgi:hypothetical protein
VFPDRFEALQEIGVVVVNNVDHYSETGSAVILKT